MSACLITLAIQEFKAAMELSESTKHLAIKIPLRNKDSETVANALVDEEDRYLESERWNLHGDGYAQKPAGRGLMHVVIMGKAPAGHVIDHINGDRLDNRRINLRFATLSLNASNKRSNKVTSSQYNGVTKFDGMWYANFKSKYIGRYKTEVAAAWAYNLAAYYEFGNQANFNLVEKPEGWKDSRRDPSTASNLPRGVSQKHKNKELYSAYLRFDKTSTFLGSFGTVAEASRVYEEARAAMESKREQDHNNQEITKDEQGAFIMAGDTKIHVSDSDWHDLSKHGWCMSQGYLAATIYNDGARNTVKIHQYLLGSREGFVIDHIDGDRTNNKRENLRFATPGLNNHNKKSRSKWGYKGIYQNGNGTFNAEITHSGTKYRLCAYPTAEVAAYSYDQAALQLYGSDAWTNGVECPNGYIWDSAKMRLIYKRR